MAALRQPTDDSGIDARTDEVLAGARADRARRIKDNRAKRTAAAANAKRSPRSFVLTWTDLEGWSQRYDVEQIASEVTPDDWALSARPRRDQSVRRRHQPHSGIAEHLSR